ncbi:MAG: allantoinase AllB [Peptostreptococcales bacterium]
MLWDHIIKNGTIVTSTEEYRANIYIKDSKIAAITCEELEGEAREITDAEGKYIFSGFIDTHVHSRDKGGEHKEDFFHSTRAAAAGGITMLFEMPNAIPAIWNKENFNQQVENLSRKAHIDFALWGLCLGDLNNHCLGELSEAGAIAFKFFWGYAIDKKTYQLVYNYKPGMRDDVLAPLSDGEVYKIFREVEKTGKCVAIHAENASLIETLSNEPELLDANLGEYEKLVESRPGIAEEMVIQTAVSLAKKTKCRLHILHVSSKDGTDAIRRAQEKGLPITAETCPHFLFLSTEDFNRVGPKMKAYPPVKYKEDQNGIWEGIQDRTITMVCSDHAPHTKEEKTGGLYEIPAGICGVETLAPLMIGAVSEGKITKNELASLLSENPAKIFHLYPQKGSLQVGTDADITIVDFNANMTIKEDELHSKSKVTAFDGFKIKGKPVATIVRGHTIMKDGQIIDEVKGKFVKG